MRNHLAEHDFGHGQADAGPSPYKQVPQPHLLPACLLYLLYMLTYKQVPQSHLLPACTHARTHTPRKPTVSGDLCAAAGGFGGSTRVATWHRIPRPAPVCAQV
ncbi:MAG: hypothetical protein ACPIOQ_16400, partial [Promethearchaeia archaeon]